MNRIKALYRSWAIPCGGADVYAPRHRAEWLAKLAEPGVRVRADAYTSNSISAAAASTGAVRSCGRVTSILR